MSEEMIVTVKFSNEPVALDSEPRELYQPDFGNAAANVQPLPCRYCGCIKSKEQ